MRRKNGAAQKKLEALYGIKLDIPLETLNDLVKEAQAVINYYETQGIGFEKLDCKNCGLPFAYAWDVKGVKYCSIECTAAALEKIGLKWNPTKSPQERWGRTAPAVISHIPLSILEDLNGTQELPTDNTLTG